MELNALRGSSIETLHSIELKFDMYIMYHSPTYCIDFGEFRINSFITAAQKYFLYITVYARSKYSLSELC